MQEGGCRCRVQVQVEREKREEGVRTLRGTLMERPVATAASTLYTLFRPMSGVKILSRPMGVLTVMSLSQMPVTSLSTQTSAVLSLMAYVTTGTAVAKRLKSSAYGSAAYTDNDS